MNNPVMLIDPDGRDIEVVDNGDGTFKVVGGNLNDKDRGIYVVKAGKDGSYERTGEKLGKSLTMYPFYNADKQDGPDQVGWKRTIYTKSNESGSLVSNFIKEADNLSLSEYIPNATDGKTYDFKSDGDP